MKTFVAIDSQNLYYSARRHSGNGLVDFQKLWDRISDSEKDFLGVVYVVRGEYDSSSFEGLLRGVGYRISPRTSIKIRDGGKQRVKYDGHEVRITLDAAVTYQDKYDKFILITGDVDYSDLFAVLVKMGKKTEFWSFDRKPHPDLVQVVDKVVFLDGDLLQEG